MQTNRRTPLVLAMTLLVTAVLWAADNRTVLKPGWNMFSPKQDVEVGQQVSTDAERQLPMLKNSRLDNYVNNLGRRLAAMAPGEKYPYEFKVVNDRAINAFALPGGPIYINRGVIEAADNEAQLGVLYLVFARVLGEMPEWQQAVLTTILGVLTAAVPQILSFWFGSSMGSARKTAALAASSPALGENGK